MTFGISAASVTYAAPQAAAPKIVTEHPDFADLLMQGKFAEIETLATDYRATQARQAGALWAIEDVYSQLSDFSDRGCDCDGSGGDGRYTFDQKRQAFEHWRQNTPDSLTAKIGLADLWQRHAWHSRGPQYAADTTSEQWRLFREDMQRAEELLHPLDRKADPEIYLLEMGAAPAGEDARLKLDTLYTDAIRDFPNFPNYAVERFRFLQEFWYGRPGEAAAFTRSLLSSPGGDDGLVAYFAAARVLLTIKRDATAMSASGAEYPELIKAFALRRRLFGNSWTDLNVLMYYAMASGDKKSVTMLSDKIAGHWKSSVWGDKASYDRAIAWAAAWP